MHSEEGAAVKAQLQRTDVIERKDRMMLLEVTDDLRILAIFTPRRKTEEGPKGGKVYVIL